MAQLVEQAAMREVVSLTLAGPTLTVLKELRRKCCLGITGTSANG